MANLLSVTKSNSIQHLQQLGLSQRKIAEAVSVDRKTVRKHLAELTTSKSTVDESKGTTAPTGSDGPVEATNAIYATSAGKSASHCATFAELIEQKLDRGLTAQRIFQDLRFEHAFDGSYWSVNRAGIEKHVTSHTFRHSFATHLLPKPSPPAPLPRVRRRGEQQVEFRNCLVTVTSQPR